MEIFEWPKYDSNLHIIEWNKQIIKDGYGEFYDEPNDIEFIDYDTWARPYGTFIDVLKIQYKLLKTLDNVQKLNLIEIENDHNLYIHTSEFAEFIGMNHDFFY